ncbi:MAG TPA: sulfoxide reductase heme-binding subunit YedZ [Chloroflexi bacterium]|nr:sulfoxide reductase heme-binding subunit YedZ [Chloroflexota bacterium]
MKRNNLLKKTLPVLVHIGALVPLAIMLWGFFDNQFINPIQELTFRTGRYALHLLILSLACTPLNTFFGWRWAISLRKMLGLYAFMYAALHFSIFVGLDYGFNWELLSEAIFEKRYALVGFTAFLILLPLAITSTKGWMKRLGRNWKRLHRLVYLTALLVIVHFIWLVKGDIQRPLIYGAVVVFLLILRWPPIRKWAGSLRRLLASSAKNASLI